jgi:hypothetical protein
VNLFGRESLREKLARQGGLIDSPPAEDRRAPWDKAGIHGVHRPREWDEVATVEANVPGDQARLVVLDDRIVIEEGPDEGAQLVDALSLEPPFRDEAALARELLVQRLAPEQVHSTPLCSVLRRGSSRRFSR